MQFLKKFFKFIFKFLLILLIVLAIIIGGLFIWHFATIQAANDYLPGDFLVYLKIDSIKDIYENVIDLRAADVIFSSSEDLKSIYKALMGFKSTKLSKNYFFNQLLKVRTDLIVHQDYTPVLVFDPGLLSIPFRLIPFVDSLIKIEGIEINRLTRGKALIYQFKIEENNLYFSFNNNLIFFSTVERNITNLYENKKNSSGLKYNNALEPLEGKIKAGGFAEIYLNSNSLIRTIAQSNPDLKKITEQLSFNSFSAVSFKISNEDIFISAYTKISTDNELLTSFLSYKPAGLQVLKYLPESANIYSTVNFQSFREILDIILLIKGKELEKTIADVDSTSKLIFGIGIDQLLFDWIGNEVGLFSVAETPEPAVFLKIGDKAKWNYAWSKIEGSAFFKEENSLLLDNIRVKKIVFPPFLRNMVGLFVKGLDTPYFIEVGDFVFFSMNPEVLANVVNNYQQDRLLIRRQEYKEISRSTPQNANVFLYYDLSSKLPSFLAANNMVTDILKLYEKGLMAIHFTDEDVKIDISAAGVAGKKTIVFPGYPKVLNDGTSGRVYCQGLAGSKDYKLLYINKNAQLIIQDVFNDTYIDNPVEKNSEILISKNETTGKNEIFVYCSSGTLYKYDERGKLLAPFPVVTEYKNSFLPVIYKNMLTFFSSADKLMSFLARDGQTTTPFGFSFTKSLLSPPAFSGDLVTFYPKSFSGEIYLTDAGGVIQEGWPQLGGGISFGSPFFVTGTGRQKLVGFLNQAGVLNLWQPDGQPVEGFPLSLNGVFYSNPLLISTDVVTAYLEPLQGRGMLTVNADGNLYLVDLRGVVLKQKMIDGIKGKESRIALFDFDKDGIEEIFIYGETNYITGLGKNFEPLPGFPVKGSMCPAFADLNYDGLYEMITGSFDGNVYAYTLNK